MANEELKKEFMAFGEVVAIEAVDRLIPAIFKAIVEATDNEFDNMLVDQLLPLVQTYARTLAEKIDA